MHRASYSPAAAAAGENAVVGGGGGGGGGGGEGGWAGREGALLVRAEGLSGVSAVTIFPDNSMVAEVGEGKARDAAEEKRSEAGEMDLEVSERVMMEPPDGPANGSANGLANDSANGPADDPYGPDGRDGPDVPDGAVVGAESPLPPYARLRASVKEEPVVSVDIAKKVKVKDAPTAANTYAAKKTVAQGMMDIALITSNANQLRYMFEFARGSDFFQLNVSLIVISLFLQIAVGVTLIFKGRADLRGEHKMEHANRLNNYVVVGVFLVTIINVLLAAFSVSNNNKGASSAAPILQAPPTTADAARSS